jgi:hypothetical protein
MFSGEFKRGAAPLPFFLPLSFKPLKKERGTQGVRWQIN